MVKQHIPWDKANNFPKYEYKGEKKNVTRRIPILYHKNQYFYCINIKLSSVRSINFDPDI
jgi:hypothetical protein